MVQWPSADFRSVIPVRCVTSESEHEEKDDDADDDADGDDDEISGTGPYTNIKAIRPDT